MFTCTRGEEHRDSFQTELLCRIMDVSPRGLRAFRSRPASRRQRIDLVTLAHIKEQSRLSLGSYGRPRMTEELKEIGLNVGHRRVGRLMRQNGISVVRTRKHKVTTDSDHKFNIAPNLLDRNFAADQSNQKWAGDISYVWTREGWQYVRRQAFWNYWLPKPRERLAHAGLPCSATPGAFAISPVERN